MKKNNKKSIGNFKYIKRTVIKEATTRGKVKVIKKKFFLATIFRVLERYKWLS